ncbi:MAG: carboxy terminal-processing peptidase [Planctomycetaceae bacterium]|jgi:carboxyl-terminal processing protease|nr:carboxy terminal-processing peptidase [Planctomycetaceae bacterium]
MSSSFYSRKLRVSSTVVLVACALVIACVSYFSPPQSSLIAEPVQNDSQITEAENGTIPVPTLVPRAKDRIIARNFASILQFAHLQHPNINDEVSERAYKLFIEGLDPFKLYFYQQDIDEFNQYKDQFDDFVKEGDLGVPFKIYNRYLQRIDERVATALKLVDTQHDFTKDEDVIQDKKTVTYAKSPEESYDRWRKKVKYDILDLKEEIRTKEKDRIKKLEEEGKSPEEAVATAKAEADKDKTNDPLDRLKRRYANIRKRMLVVNSKGISPNDDVLELFLTTISNALDPHSTYMSPASYKNFLIQMELSLEGIGATLQSVDGYTIVKQLVKGGAADKSGLLHNEDKILAVGQGKDGLLEEVVDWKLSDVVDRIRGKKGTIVRLEVQPEDGSERKTIEITREVIKLEDSEAKGEVFEAGKKANGSPYKVGVVNLPSFYLDMNAAMRGDPNAKSTTTDVKRILEGFNKEGIDAVVVDLRYNGGGSLQEVVTFTGLFIETGNVVRTKDQMPGAASQPRIRSLDDRDPSITWTGPLVVVVNKFSASASEIFAGAIKDYGRGLIVGDSRTHGKGSVQQMKDLAEALNIMSDESSYGAIKLTIQGFYTPSGVSPQTKGVKSDVIIPSLSDVYEDICEEDLDYPLHFENIPDASNYPHDTYVPKAVIPTLQKNSNERVKKSKEFEDIARDILLYKELKAKKTVTLNEEKYFAEQDRLRASRREKKEMEKLIDSNRKIERDDYLNEVLDLTIDYVNQLMSNGVKFPEERSKSPKRSAINLRDIFGT